MSNGTRTAPHAALVTVDTNARINTNQIDHAANRAARCRTSNARKNTTGMASTRYELRKIESEVKDTVRTAGVNPVSSTVSSLQSNCQTASPPITSPATATAHASAATSRARCATLTPSTKSTAWVTNSFLISRAL